LLEKIKQLERRNKKRNSIALRPVKIQNDFSAISAALSASKWIKKAIALWSNGNFTSPSKAIEYLTRALELDPRNPRTYNSRAIAYLSVNRETEAREDLEHALRLNPKYVDAFNNLGSLHYRRGEYEAAINSYTQALQYQPDFVEAILNRGMASRKLFNFEDAFEDFKRVMLLAPETFVRKDRAGALVQLNDLRELCRKSETACKMDLCRSLTFLQKRGFCLTSENKQQ
jgi:tetratricopeptide (TPR) repeat protein